MNFDNKTIAFAALGVAAAGLAFYFVKMRSAAPPAPQTLPGKSAVILTPPRSSGAQ